MRIIDGYNVIGAAGRFGLDLSQPDKEERLLRLLSSFRSRRRRQAMFVVFDGHYGRLTAGPRRYSHMGIDVEWSLGETAAAVIMRKVHTAARAQEIEVVTSDQIVLRAIVNRGARGMRSPEFLDEVARVLADAPDAEKPEEPSKAEVAEWLDRFGDGR